MSDSAVVPQSYDLFASEAVADPMPLLHRIRAESPVSVVPQLDAYLLTRHSDIVAVLKDRRLSPANTTPRHPSRLRRAGPHSRAAALAPAALA
jgi:cytochrome P450